MVPLTKLHIQAWIQAKLYYWLGPQAMHSDGAGNHKLCPQIWQVHSLSFVVGWAFGYALLLFKIISQTLRFSRTASCTLWFGGTGDCVPQWGWVTILALWSGGVQAIFPYWVESLAEPSTWVRS